MKNNIEFIKKVVHYYNKNHSTVRETAKNFGISKSLVYYYLTKVLPNDTSKEILSFNKSQRHIRGGEATKNKYLLKRRSK